MTTSSLLSRGTRAVFRGIEKAAEAWGSRRLGPTDYQTRVQYGQTAGAPISDPPIPLRLYKYVAAERHDVLENACIRFTSPSDCNDPFEIKPIVKMIAPETPARELMDRALRAKLPEQFQKYPQPFRDLFFKLEEAGALEEVKQQALGFGMAVLHSITPTVLERITDEFGQRLGILSLTEDPVSPPMWAHYAENHRGMVIEFDAHHLWFHRQLSDKDELRHLRKVLYVENLECEYLVDMEGWKLCYQKLKHWEYEREWRIVRPLQEADTKLESGVCLFKFPPEVVTRVICGCRASEDLKLKIYGLKRDNPCWKHLAICEAHLDARTGSIRLQDTTDVLKAQNHHMSG